MVVLRWKERKGERGECSWWGGASATGRGGGLAQPAWSPPSLRAWAGRGARVTVGQALHSFVDPLSRASSHLSPAAAASLPAGHYLAGV